MIWLNIKIDFSRYFMVCDLLLLINWFRFRNYNPPSPDEIQFPPSNNQIVFSNYQSLSADCATSSLIFSLPCICFFFLLLYFGTIRLTHSILKVAFTRYLFVNVPHEKQKTRKINRNVGMRCSKKWRVSIFFPAIYWNAHAVIYIILVVRVTIENKLNLYILLSEIWAADFRPRSDNENSVKKLDDGGGR